MVREFIQDLNKASRSTQFRRQNQLRAQCRATQASNAPTVLNANPAPDHRASSLGSWRISDDEGDLEIDSIAHQTATSSSNTNLPTHSASIASSPTNQPPSPSALPSNRALPQPVLNPVDKICEKVLQFYNKHKCTNSALNDLLQLIEFVLKSAQSSLNFPRSLYLFKLYLKLNLNKTFYFKTACCSAEIVNFKQLDKIVCVLCNVEISRREIIMARNYFFRYSIGEQIKFLVNIYGLAAPVFSSTKICTPYDGLLYREILNENLNKKVVFLKFYSDGVELYRSSKTQAWPLFVKIDALRTEEKNKIFLNSCFVGTGKPEPHFFLRELIRELNELWTNGVYIEKLNEIIYPAMSYFFLDAGAR